MEDQYYCRLCMEEENLMHMDNSVIDCIKNEFSIEVRDNDNLSKELCNLCHEFITEVIEFNKKREELKKRIEKFKLNADKKQKLLQKIVKRKDSHVSIDVTNEAPSCPSTSCETDKPDSIENRTNKNAALENEKLISEAIRSINLDEVEKTAEKLMLIWTPSNNFCKVCKMKISDFEKFKKHVESEAHRLKAKVIEKCGNIDIFSTHKLVYRCETCKRIFSSKTGLFSHKTKDHKQFVRKDHLKPVVIPKKNKRNINVKKDDESHASEIKVKDEPENTDNANVNPINKCKEHPCKYCTNRSFGFIESLQRHIKKHHKGVHVCIRCEFTTTNNKSFSDHLRKHYNLTRLQRVCSLCFQVFNSHTDLLSHRKIFHCTKVLKICSICNASFTNTTFLKKHQRSVHGISVKQRRPSKYITNGSVLICLKCNKSLKPSSLKTHTLKCASITASSSNNVPTKSKISRVQKLPKARESRSPIIQHSCIETDSVSKKRGVDSAELSANKKIKTVARQSTSNSVNHTNALSSVTELKQRGESCATTLTKITPQSTSEIQTNPVCKLDSSLKNPCKKNKEKLMKNISIDSSKKENTIACRKCSLIFKDTIFLSRHESTAHSASADTILPTPSNLITNRNDHRIGQPETTTYDNATQFSEPKRNQPLPPTHEKNEQTLKPVAHIFDRANSVTLSTQSAKIIRLNERVPEKNVPILGQSTTIQRVVNYQNNSSSTPKKNHQSPAIKKLPSHPNMSTSTPKEIDTNVYRLPKIQVSGNPNATHSTPKKIHNIVHRLPENHVSVDPRTKQYSTPKKNHNTNDNLAEMRESNHSTKSIPKRNEHANERSMKIQESAINQNKPYFTPKKNDRIVDQSSGTPVDYSIRPVSSSKITSSTRVVNPSWLKNHVTTDNQTSLEPSEKRIINLNYPYRQETLTASTKIDYKMADQNHYSVNSNNAISPAVEAHNHHGASTARPVTNSTASKLPMPQSSANDFKKFNQFADIQSGQLTCLKCKNPEPHPFCNLCILCFPQDDMRYLLHMKKKHPQLIKC